jgi:hypothetical protein
MAVGSQLAEMEVLEAVKTISEWMAERGISLEELLPSSGLDRRTLAAIVQGHYTTSPQQRERLAAGLGIRPEQVAWGHRVSVDHMYGHGPQFGRSP